MLEALQQLSKPDKGVLIGVVDGLPDLECPTLSTANLSIEQSMVPDDVGVPNSHGTEICSLIFGRPPKAQGLARGCSGLSLPIFFSSNDQASARPASQMDLARALTIAVERGVSIVNVSAGQKASTPEAGRHLEDALSLCDRHRMLVVAAAGNDCCACLHVPAAVSTVLAVGAMDEAGQPIDASNWGESYTTNGLLAPGVDLDVVGPGDQAYQRTGTSYATAVVSAVAARLLSAARRSGNEIDALDVRSILIESADPCEPRIDGNCARILAGKLNLDRAIKLLNERSEKVNGTFVVKSRSALLQTTRETVPMGKTGRTTDATASLTTSDGGLEGALKVSGQVDQQACSCGGDEEPKDGVEAAAIRASAPAADVSPSSPSMPITQQGSVGAAAIQASAPVADVSPSAPLITQQACACGGDQPPQLVYAIGTPWFDFGTEARYDAIVQNIGEGGALAANTPLELFRFLTDNRQYTNGITFILMQDQIPVYAIQPSGTFATEIIDTILGGLNTILEATAEQRDKIRIAVPGVVSGVTRLMNGMILPVLYPDLRGIVKLEPSKLVDAAMLAAEAAATARATVPEGEEALPPLPAFRADHVLNFLVRVWDELRNLGMNPEERAINHASTNAFGAATALADAVGGRRLELFAIRVSKSPICRPDSDCWDVQLQMFDPENERRAGRVYRYTIDVSEILPVTVGPMRDWAVPLVTM